MDVWAGPGCFALHHGTSSLASSTALWKTKEKKSLYSSPQSHKSLSQYFYVCVILQIILHITWYKCCSHLCILVNENFLKLERKKPKTRTNRYKYCQAACRCTSTSNFTWRSAHPPKGIVTIKANSKLLKHKWHI